MIRALLLISAIACYEFWPYETLVVIGSALVGLCVALPLSHMYPPPAKRKGRTEHTRYLFGERMDARTRRDVEILERAYGSRWGQR